MPSPAPKRSAIPTMILLGGIGLASAALITLAGGGDKSPSRPAFHDARPLIAETVVPETAARSRLNDWRPLAVEPIAVAPSIETRPDKAAEPETRTLQPVPQPVVALTAEAPVSVEAAPVPEATLADTAPPKPSLAPFAPAPAISPPPSAVERETALIEPTPATLDVAPTPFSAPTLATAPDGPVAAPVETTAAAVEPPPRPASVAAGAMVRRAQTYLETGDIAGARLFLERGVAQGDGQSALLLGSSYDPLWLAERGAHGVAADVAKARALYVRALELGVAEASARMRKLEVVRR